MSNIYLDIETSGLNPYYGHRITCIVAKHDSGRVFKTCLQSEADMLDFFAEWLDSMPKDCVLVTKNGKAFDIPFIVWRGIVNNKECLQLHRLLGMDHVDLHEITKKWVSLDDMAKLLKIEGKSSSGFEAVNMWNQGRTKELLDYCYHDVLVTEAVFKRFEGLEFIKLCED